MLRWIRRKGGPRYNDIEKLYNTSVKAYDAGERPRGSRLNASMRHSGAYPVKLPKPRCTRARHWWANYWYTAWPCHTYIEKLPARCGASDIDDQYANNSDVPQDRFEISYAPYHRPCTGKPLPLLVWRPDGVCVISTSIFSYGENGRRDRVYGFTPVQYVWTHYGHGFFTMTNYWRTVSGKYTRDVENQYRVPFTGVVRVPMTWSEGVPVLAGDWVNKPNPGFAIPADRRKRPYSVIPYELYDGSATQRLQSAADITRSNRIRSYARRAVTRVLDMIDRNLEAFNFTDRATEEENSSPLRRLMLEENALDNYVRRRVQRVRTAQTVRAAATKHSVKHLDYEKDRGRALHFENV